MKRWFKRHESKYSNQISELKKFEPGSSYKFEIVYSHILNKFYYKLLLKDVLPKLSENHGGFHSFYNGYWCDLSTILWIYYINNVDFFGNHIDFQHNGSIPIKFSYDKKSMSDDPFWVVIKTSKNNYFFSRVCFYPKEHKTIPFIALMLEDRDNIKIE